MGLSGWVMVRGRVRGGRSKVHEEEGLGMGRIDGTTRPPGGGWV